MLSALVNGVKGGKWYALMDKVFALETLRAAWTAHAQAVVRERSRHIQRIRKVLEDANLKIDAELSDMLGKSGRAILHALVAGETDPVRLAALAHRNVKSPQAKLAEALQGRVRQHHRFLLKLHLQQIDGLDASLATIDGEIEANLAPFCTAIDIVSSHPGINKPSAEAIVSEIGVDMSRFATAGHLVSWAHLCPRNAESAGKRRSNRLRQGGRWLKTTLVQCAHAAKNKRGSYYQAQYLRLRSRRGPQKAICAVAASMLTASYHMLTNGTFYHDLGADHFGRRSRQTDTRPLVKRLEHMGYAVQIAPLAA
jgi:transposase